MGTQGTGRKRSTKKERSTAEDDALNLIAREAEARLAAKRAARAEAREIRMKELERQQKEIFQVQKKYYGLNTKSDDRSDSKWGDIEQWMEDSERYSRSSRIQTLSDDDERMSVGSRGSVRDSTHSHKKSKKKKKHKHKDRDRNSCDDDYSVISSRSSRLSDESRVSRSSRLDLTSSRLSDDTRVSRSSRLDLQPASYASSDLYSFNGLSSSRNPGSSFNGYQPLEYSSYRSSGSRASSRAGSARASPVDNCGSVASFLRSAASSSSLHRDLDDVTIPDFSDVEDRDYLEKGSRAASSLTAATLTSLGGSSSRRGSGETAVNVDAETSLREIKEIHELKDQIQDVEAKYMQNLKEVKDALVEVEEKYRKAMVSNAQLDNEKNNLMYQVDTLKDSLMELEELLAESRRGYEEKVKEYDREKHAHSVLQFQFSEMKETLKQSEELLNEIRQLRIKQEGFVREISDLQETVEWKDKKIGALERQKEYTDAIRIERDELREEVVKLKDILKKHGIVLGPDLNVNGEVGESEVDGSLGADPDSQPAQDSKTYPVEGNSMLGNTDENRLRSSEEEKADPEQRQEIFEEAKDSPLSSDTLCDVAGVSTLETSSEEQQTYLEEDKRTTTKEDKVEESYLSKDNVENNDQSITDAKDITVSSPGLQGILTSSEENVPEMPEGGDLGETETKSSSVDTYTGDITESGNNIFDAQENKQGDEESNSINTELCHQQTVELDDVKECLPDEFIQVPAVSNPEPQQENNNAGETENDEAEEVSRKAQSQGAAASGKKKKRKRRGKKKGGAQEDNNQQKGGTDDKEKSKAEPEINSSVTETFEESRVDQVTKEQDSRKTDEVEPVKPTQTISPNESLQESRMDHVTDERNKEQTLEVKEVEAAKAVATEAFSPNESLQESRMDHVTDERNKEQTLEVKEVEAAKAVATEAFSPNESLQESRMDHLTDERDKEQTLEEVEAAKAVTTEAFSYIEEGREDHSVDEQNKEHTLEVEEVEAAKAVATEALSHIEEDHGMDEQNKEQTVEVEKVESAKAVATEALSHIETHEERREDHGMDEQNNKSFQSLETEAVETVEAVKPAHVESTTDPRKEQVEEQILETEKVADVGSIPQTNLSTSDLIDNSKDAESTDDHVKESSSSLDKSKGEADISNNGNVGQAESETVDKAEDEVRSTDEMKSECSTDNPENTCETSSKDELLVPSSGNVAAEESESISSSQSKDNASVSDTDGFTDAPKSLSGSEPSAAVESGSDNSPIEVSDRKPKGTTETVKDDEKPGSESEQESCSPSADREESELKADATEKVELKEAEGLVEPDDDDKSDRDSASLTKNTDTFDTVESPLETAAIGEQPDVVESQTLQREDQIDESNIELSSEMEEIISLKEATEIGCPVEQDQLTEESAAVEDPEHKNSQNDQQPSKDKSDDYDSSQPTLQESDDEDGDDDEGQSFDFDDMDVEAAVATSLLEHPNEEEVEEAKVIINESNNSSLSNENREDELIKSIDDTVDEGNQTDPEPQDNQNSLTHEDVTSDKGEDVENVCEKQKNIPEKEVGVADEPRHITEEGKGLNVGELVAVAEDIDQAKSLPTEEGLHAIKHETPGENLDLPKSAEQVASHKEPQQTGKDVRKNGKKGKGKGKEECKMS